MACVLCLDKFFCYFCFKKEEEDELNEPLQEQDTSSFWTTKEAAKVAEGSIRYSSVPDADGDDETEIDSKYDPDEEYIKNFERLGWHTSTLTNAGISSSGIDEIVCETERILSSASSENLTPREIVQSLKDYNRCIRLTSDLEKKRVYIQRYETHKFDFDEDNLEDKDKAELNLRLARNTEKKSIDRIEYYQIAIKFTNNYAEKQKLKQEYRSYVATLRARNSHF